MQAPLWHKSRAVECAAARNWFAARFHLRQLDRLATAAEDGHLISQKGGLLFASAYGYGLCTKAVHSRNGEQLTVEQQELRREFAVLSLARLKNAVAAKYDYKRDLSHNLSEVWKLLETLATTFLADEPLNTEALRQISLWYFRLGEDNRERGELREAISFFDRDLRITERLALVDPDKDRPQKDLDATLAKLGDVNRKLGRDQEAHRFYIRSLAIRERLAKADPGDTDLQNDLSLLLTKLGDVALKVGKVDDAFNHFVRKRDVVKLLVQGDPKNKSFRASLAFALTRLGKVASQKGELEDAVRFYQQGLEVREVLAEDDSGSSERLADLTNPLEELVDLTVKRRDFDAAQRYAARHLEIRTHLAQKSPDDAAAQHSLAFSRFLSGNVYSERFAYTDAAEQYRAAVLVLDRLIDDGRDIEAHTKEKDFLAGRVTYLEQAATATADWPELLKQPEDDLPALLTTRCSEFGKQGKFDRVEESADKLRELSSDAPQTNKATLLYDAACGYGVCATGVRGEAGTELSEELQEKRRKLIDQSLQCLQDAVAAGFSDFERMADDSDLSALFELPEFKKLLPDE